MKKLVICSAAVLFAITFTSLQAQTKDVAEKGKLKETKEELKSEKKELRTERKALRELEGIQVSDMAKNQFYADFGNVPDARWERSKYFDEVSFTYNGTKMTAFYDDGGMLVGTTSLKKFSDIPVSAQKEIRTKYRDYKIGAVIYFDDNEANDMDMMLYGVQFDDADNYFIELTKGTDKIVLQVNTSGTVFYFTQL